MPSEQLVYLNPGDVIRASQWNEMVRLLKRKNMESEGAEDTDGTSRRSRNYPPPYRQLTIHNAGNDTGDGSNPLPHVVARGYRRHDAVWPG